METFKELSLLVSLDLRDGKLRVKLRIVARNKSQSGFLILRFYTIALIMLRLPCDHFSQTLYWYHSTHGGGHNKLGCRSVSGVATSPQMNAHANILPNPVIIGRSLFGRPDGRTACGMPGSPSRLSRTPICPPLPQISHAFAQAMIRNQAGLVKGSCTHVWGTKQMYST
jgi:hypothetical protein